MLVATPKTDLRTIKETEMFIIDRVELNINLVIVISTWLICFILEGCIMVPLGGVSSILLISQKPTGKMEGDVLW